MTFSAGFCGVHRKPVLLRFRAANTLSNSRRKRSYVFNAPGPAALDVSAVPSGVPCHKLLSVRKHKHIVQCVSNPGASNPESEQPKQADATAQNNEKRNGSSDTWLQLPLLIIATFAKANDHWLAIRSRSKWWKRGDKVDLTIPKDRIEHVKLPPNESAAELWLKVLPLGLIFFCASFNLTLLQNLKDAIMITTAGVETLPFLSAFFVLPASLAFFWFYGNLVNRLQPQRVFYAAVLPLVGFYMFFASVLFPASQHLHPQAALAGVYSLLPAGLHGLIKVAEHWTFSLFFCFAELWGSVVISVLFWSLANEVCSVDEAKTVYPMMGIAANIALVVAGSYVKFVNKTLAAGSMQTALPILVTTIVALTALMMGAKYIVDTRVPHPANSAPPKKKKKQKGSLGESFAVLKSSPKILNLAVLVVSYAISHRLFEFAWKGQLRTVFPTAAAYQGALADVSIATGWSTITLMLLGKFVFEYLGWGVAAAATPAVMLVSGAVFFGTSLAAQFLPAAKAAAFATAGVTAGAVTQVFARSAKFSLFDPAKEMVYIEMTKDEKSKGKAAVDLVGSQLGKSGAAWSTQLLLLVFGSISASLPVITTVFAAVIVMWLRSVWSLRQQMQEMEKQRKLALSQTSTSDDGGLPPSDAALLTSSPASPISVPNTTSSADMRLAADRTATPTASDADLSAVESQHADADVILNDMRPGGRGRGDVPHAVTSAHAEHSTTNEVDWFAFARPGGRARSNDGVGTSQHVNGDNDARGVDWFALMRPGGRSRSPEPQHASEPQHTPHLNGQHSAEHSNGSLFMRPGGRARGDVAAVDDVASHDATHGNGLNGEHASDNGTDASGLFRPGGRSRDGVAP